MLQGAARMTAGGSADTSAWKPWSAGRISALQLPAEMGTASAGRKEAPASSRLDTERVTQYLHLGRVRGKRSRRSRHCPAPAQLLQRRQRRRRWHHPVLADMWPSTHLTRRAERRAESAGICFAAGRSGIPSALTLRSGRVGAEVAVGERASKALLASLRWTMAAVPAPSSGCPGLRMQGR
jgi:hypothetical protein